MISSDSYYAAQSNTKVPVYLGKFCTIGVKYQIYIRAACTTYTIYATSNPEQKEENTYIKTYKDYGRMQIIQQKIYNIFGIPDPNNTKVKWDVFQCMGLFPLKYVIAHIQKIGIKADKYTIDKLDSISQYLHNTLKNDLLNKVLNRVNISVRMSLPCEYICGGYPLLCEYICDDVPFV